METTEASGIIVSEAVVTGESALNAGDGANIVYSAGGSIFLDPSFEAEYTSTFSAHIVGCEPVVNLKSGSTKQVNSIFNNLNVLPNPFSNYAEMEFYLTKESRLTATIFDVVGNQIVTLVNNKQYQTGKHQIPINGTDLPAGIYYCIIQAGNQFETQKMVLTK